MSIIGTFFKGVFYAWIAMFVIALLFAFIAYPPLAAMFLVATVEVVREIGSFVAGFISGIAGG